MPISAVLALQYPDFNMLVPPSPLRPASAASSATALSFYSAEEPPTPLLAAATPLPISSHEEVDAEAEYVIIPRSSPSATASGKVDRRLSLPALPALPRRLTAASPKSSSPPSPTSTKLVSPKPSRRLSLNTLLPTPRLITRFSSPPRAFTSPTSLVSPSRIPNIPKEEAIAHSPGCADCLRSRGDHHLHRTGPYTLTEEPLSLEDESAASHSASAFGRPSLRLDTHSTLPTTAGRGFNEKEELLLPTYSASSPTPISLGTPGITMSPRPCHRVWLCTPPRSPTSPTTSPSISRDTSTASLSTLCISTARSSRPIVTRAMTTGKIHSSSCDDQGVVMSVSSHSEKVLGRGLCPSTWRASRIDRRESEPAPHPMSEMDIDKPKLERRTTGGHTKPQLQIPGGVTRTLGRTRGKASRTGVSSTEKLPRGSVVQDKKAARQQEKREVTRRVSETWRKKASKVWSGIRA